MTPEEKEYYQRKYAQDLDSAQQTKRKLQNQIEQDKSAYMKVNAAKSELNSRKKNLEERLSDVKQILSLLNGSVSTHINQANQSAVSASEKYTGAIVCSSVVSSSIQEAYKTLGVQNESNSLDTFNRCKAEITRLENAIVEIQTKIRDVDAKISALASALRSAASAYSAAEQAVRSTQWKIDNL